MARKKRDEVVLMIDLHKYYGSGSSRYHALKGISLSVEKGDYVSVMGPSGSGKSTLLHVMGLFDDYEQGEYYLDGIDVKSLSEAEKAKIRSQKIGFVFQMFYLIPSITVLDNIVLPGLLINRPREELEKKAVELAERFAIAGELNKFPNKISGGQMQRAAIARALINDPAMLLMDEPTGNLDSKSGSAVLELVDELHDEGKTIVLITHDSNVAKRASRLIRIFDGMIVKEE